MRAAVLYSAAGSLLLTTLVATQVRGDPERPGGPERTTASKQPAASKRPVAPEPPGSAGAAVSEARGAAIAAARAAAAGIRFGKCDQAVPGEQCGTVKVPLDYAHPDGRQIALTVSRARATGKDPNGGRRKVARQGALVFNPGGPGASGMYFGLVGMLPEWKRIAAAYDMVGYAPRGVGKSAPISCEDPKRRDKGPDQAPTQPSESYKKKRIAKAKAYARGCARRSGSALRYYHSVNNARDLDVLRAALGERKLTYMGASYGTYFGALYAELFPSHVRRMVFDAPVNPDPARIWYRANLDQSEAFETRWADFRTWVALHDDVYHLGRTADAVTASYEQARARLAARPAGGTVGPGELHDAMLSATYFDDYWAGRAKALSAYLAGDPQPLIRLAGPKSGASASAEAENGDAVYTAVECNDAPWPTDWATWDEDNTRLARIAPFETWDNVWMNLPCAFWHGPRLRPLDVRTEPGELAPTLILAAERDAAAPYPGALELHRRLPGSVLVTERAAGSHGIAGGPNACVNGYVDAYLLEGRLPGAPDAGCAPHAAPKPRAATPKASGKHPGGKPAEGRPEHV
jgi:pimeloyl-ACP methyl ester carboxylesterase